jgi:hypothetical protein
MLLTALECRVRFSLLLHCSEMGELLTVVVADTRLDLRVGS